jgi:hypothetical protein|tara:strand:- start:1567 stop:1698 length:132 start_codon:yes stop_codon:yes gene_type:complete
LTDDFLYDYLPDLIDSYASKIETLPTEAVPLPRPLPRPLEVVL